MLTQKSVYKYPQQAKSEKNPNVYPRYVVKKKCDISTQWNIIQPWKDMKYWCMLRHEWTLKPLC